MTTFPFSLRKVMVIRDHGASPVATAFVRTLPCNIPGCDVDVNNQLEIFQSQWCQSLQLDGSYKDISN